MSLRIGLDIGSTTVKMVILNEKDEIIHSKYKRHFSEIEESVRDIIKTAYKELKLENPKVHIMATGSAGLFLEEYMNISHTQEVVAATRAIMKEIPETDVVLELGGEDSKITYLEGSREQRMNSICAGGTGAFIDQMASILKTDASGLNEMSKKSTKTYPIASRCGVFAKTDIQALLNQGAKKEDLARSIFQSVVNQTISNLACGRTIEGNIALLGGPLHFLSELRDSFMVTLDDPKNKFIIPENGELFVALGAAYSSKEAEEISFLELLKNINKEVELVREEDGIRPPLFEDEKERVEFYQSHEKDEVPKGDLKNYKGKLYLGIDAGSTTSKSVLIGENAEILYSKYGNNEGQPLKMAVETLREIYELKHPEAEIVHSGITGYGEDFIKAALDIDVGEVETIAHFRAASFFDPEVDFILDIGGQDMKAMYVKDGVIEDILLNEACSSGCGSFIETFAKSLDMTLDQFQEEAMKAKEPVDLGNRCTVFMNSMVKQAQKEGASVGDIAAGLCYSVMDNAITKVIGVQDGKDLGEHIVVQGGTFYGDANLRAFEKTTGRIPVRPDIAGLMGAFGMALIAQEASTGESTLVDPETLEDFSYEQRQVQCKKCQNYCQMTVNIFQDGSRFITGNRCEKGAGISLKSGEELPNLYDYKYKRLFDYESLTEGEAPRGVIGLPRVLNMYENYPFWHTFFTELGYSVVLSTESTREVYDKGISSITSETACYPAKISHGHIEDLIEKGVKRIFMPGVFYEEQEFQKAKNHLNCPVVAGYSEVIKNNVDNLRKEEVEFLNPFLSLDHKKGLKRRLLETFKKDGVDEREISQAVDKACNESNQYRIDLKKEGQKALEFIKEKDLQGIVLAGRPYHVDPEINHGISQLITSLGLVVLTEDSLIDPKKDIKEELRVLDQWVYHSRLYRAAEIVTQNENLEMVQLNSFGCGLDAVTTDQVREILTEGGKIATIIKIDEVSNLGAVQIRLRSLIRAVKDREFVPKERKPEEKIEFTKDMKGYTILAPQMAREHFDILQAALESEGYHLEFLQTVNSKVERAGLKYVNNDACYPAITTIGQLMEAVDSGRYDNDKLALLMTQTGGACRASNYVGFIRKALKDAGYPNIPVIALSAQGIENHSGFKLGISALRKAMHSILYGDLIMRLSNQIRPYEIQKGEVDALEDIWISNCQKAVEKPTRRNFRKNVEAIVKDFEKIPVKEKEIPKVGIVGEILVKYLPEANNHLQELLESQGCEVILPDLTDFLMYSLRNATHKADLYNKSRLMASLSNLGIRYIESYRNIMRKALEGTRFTKPKRIEEVEELAEEVVSLGNQYGEGWLLVGEMMSLIEMGAPNIVCIQPFGCLPNHITGKGVLKKLRELYADANIIPIDYDPGAPEVNQINRIRLMLSEAWEKIERKEALEEEKENIYEN